MQLETLKNVKNKKEITNNTFLMSYVRNRVFTGTYMYTYLYICTIYVYMYKW